MSRWSVLVVTSFAAATLAACATGSDPASVDAHAIDAAAVDSPLPVDAPATDGPNVDGPTTDGPGPDGPSPDAGTDGSVGGAPDTCAQAQDLTAAAMTAGGATVIGDTTGYADDVNPSGTCTGYTPDGPDAIYTVTVAANATIQVTLTPTSSWDPSLEIVGTCTYSAACLAGADSGFSGDPETLTYVAITAGTYYIIVDGFNPTIAGPYSLNVRVQ